MTAQKLGDLLTKKTLPAQVVDEIWGEVRKDSAAQQLAKDTPMIIGDNLLPTISKRPHATIIDESEPKKASDLELGSKTVRSLKAQVGLEFTTEMVAKNPVSVLEQLQTALANAIVEQLDLAVFQGKKADDQSAISGVESFATLIENSVDLGADADTVDKSLWTGYGMLAANGRNPSAIAAAPQFMATLATAQNKVGQRLFADLSMTNGLTQVNGLPMSVSPAVAGTCGGGSPVDSKIRAIIGDFNQLRFGRALDISLERIEYGDPFGNGDLKRHNRIAFLSEVFFAYAIMDKDAFVLLKAGA